MIDLDELERLEREATPGPWELEERMRGYGIFAGRFQDFGRGPQRVHGLNLGHVSDLDANGEDNLALIIAARNALPDLIAELRTLRARVADADAVRHSLNEMVRVLDGSVNEVDADFDAEAIERVLGTAAWNDQLTVVKADTVRYWMAKIEGLRRTIKAQVGELRAARDAQSKAEEDVESLRARVAELEEDRQGERDRILGARVREVLEANGTNPERFVSEWCRAQTEYETEELEADDAI